MSLFQKERDAIQANDFQAQVQKGVLYKLHIVNVAAVHAGAADESDNAGDEPDGAPAERLRGPRRSRNALIRDITAALVCSAKIIRISVFILTPGKELARRRNPLL